MPSQKSRTENPAKNNSAVRKAENKQRLIDLLQEAPVSLNNAEEMGIKNLIRAAKRNYEVIEASFYVESNNGGSS